MQFTWELKMICLLSWTQMYHYMNISLPLTQTFHSEIYFIFRVNTKTDRQIVPICIYAAKIPAPNFIVFYNGIEPFPDFSVSRLSEAYENLHGEPNLELVVKTFNVNEGHNYNLMEHCQTLRNIHNLSHRYVRTNRQWT